MFHSRRKSYRGTAALSRRNECRYHNAWYLSCRGACSCNLRHLGSGCGGGYLAHVVMSITGCMFTLHGVSDVDVAIVLRFGSKSERTTGVAVGNVHDSMSEWLYEASRASKKKKNVWIGRQHSRFTVYCTAHLKCLIMD